MINQHSEINRTHEILQDDKKCELIVVIDCHMTSSAKYADILLPDCTASEQMDFALDASCGNMSYVIFNDQVIKPRFECKTIYEMTSELAKRLGVEQQLLKVVHRKSGCGICMPSRGKRFLNCQRLKSSASRGSLKSATHKGITLLIKPSVKIRRQIHLPRHRAKLRFIAGAGRHCRYLGIARRRCDRSTADLHAGL
ncbi:molybdopterin-dependent oxidoreductase [Escherichia coli]